MMWLITKLRSTAIFGIDRIVFPFDKSVQDLKKSSSFALAIAARVAATFWSNVSNTAFVELSSGVLNDSPPGAMSNESEPIVRLPQLGRFARCPARLPIGNDFSCGFQANLSSG